MSAVEHKAAMQRIKANRTQPVDEICSHLIDLSNSLGDPFLGAAGVICVVAHEDAKQKFLNLFRDKTEEYPELANALSSSPLFDGHYVIGLVNVQCLPKATLKDLEEFLLNPHNEKVRVVQERGAYRFYFSWSDVVADVNIPMQMILVRGACIRDPHEVTVNYLIKPKKILKKKTRK